VLAKEKQTGRLYRRKRRSRVKIGHDVPLWDEKILILTKKDGLWFLGASLSGERGEGPYGGGQGIAITREKRAQLVQSWTEISPKKKKTKKDRRGGGKIKKKKSNKKPTSISEKKPFPGRVFQRMEIEKKLERKWNGGT